MHNARPSHADFALVTINHAEDDAVQQVFKALGYPEKRLPLDRGIFAWWKMPGKESADRYVVVHGSTADAKGPLPAIELIRELDRLFKPRYFLLLGTAGGIRARGIEYGQVVFSRQVHVGYQQLLDLAPEDSKPCKVDVRLFDDPVQPPSDRLYMEAKAAALGWEITGQLKEAADRSLSTLRELYQITDGVQAKLGPAWVKHVQESFERSTKEIPVATEVFSGPYLIDGERSELFANIKATFPKVGAVEMEAGAVAQAVLRSIDSEHFVGYLVIKAISDVIDSDVPAPERKRVRKALSLYASLASAEFAKRIIIGWSGNTGQRFGQLSLVPPKYLSQITSNLGDQKNTNSLVYEDVSLSRYSQLLKDICADGNHINSLWTFCYLEPYRFFAAISEDVDSSRISSDQAMQLARDVVEGCPSKSDLQGQLFSKFPHFQVFIDLAKRSDTKVVRIVHKRPNWKGDNEYFLKDFNVINVGLTCYALDDKDLEGEAWARRDQVVINDELLFDFDESSKRLIITSLDPEGLGAEFRRFKDHCQKKGKGREFHREISTQG